MAQFNVYQAKATFSSLVERAARGEEIVVAKAGRPVVRLVPVQAGAPGRRPGRAKGRVRIGPDFDAPLPGALAVAFGFPPPRGRR